MIRLTSSAVKDTSTPQGIIKNNWAKPTVNVDHDAALAAMSFDFSQHQ
jgi:hypothetical protein